MTIEDERLVGIRRGDRVEVPVRLGDGAPGDRFGDPARLGFVWTPPVRDIWVNPRAGFCLIDTAERGLYVLDVSRRYRVRKGADAEA